MDKEDLKDFAKLCLFVVLACASGYLGVLLQTKYPVAGLFATAGFVLYVSFRVGKWFFRKVRDARRTDIDAMDDCAPFVDEWDDSTPCPSCQNVGTHKLSCVYGSNQQVRSNANF